MRILLIPDIHLGKGTSIGKDSSGIGMNSRIIDQKVLLDFARDVALREQVDRIDVLGDIWEDTNPKPATVYVFLDWLLSCTPHMKVNIIHGNHDYIRSGNNRISMLDCVDVSKINNCKIFNSIETIIDGNLETTYVPFTDRQQLGSKTINAAIDDLSYNINCSASKYNVGQLKTNCSIVIGHLALENSIWIGDEIGDDAKEIFCPLKMFDNFDYVFMGHIHNPQIMQEKTQNKPFIAHVGSLDRTAFTGPDSGPKYLTLFDSVQKSVQRIELPCRKLLDFHIVVPEGADGTNYIIEQLNKQNKKFKDSIVRIKVESTTNDSNFIDRDVIYKSLNKLGTFHVAALNEIKFNEQILIKDIDVDENMDHYKVVDSFMATIKAEEQFKLDVAKKCKYIIRAVKEL